MVFASHSFLAIVLGIYGLVGGRIERLGNPVLIVTSFVFYGYWIPAYPVLLTASILFNHVIARAACCAGDWGENGYTDFRDALLAQ